MFANHLPGSTELFRAAHTKLAASAVDQIMHANPVPGRYVRNICSDFFDAAGNFVSERQRQIVHLGNAGAIMRIRVTDADSRDANQNVRGSDLGNRNIRFLERFS
jgi:hypothetical protein